MVFPPLPLPPLPLFNTVRIIHFPRRRLAAALQSWGRVPVPVRTNASGILAAETPGRSTLRLCPAENRGMRVRGRALLLFLPGAGLSLRAENVQGTRARGQGRGGGHFSRRCARACLRVCRIYEWSPARRLRLQERLQGGDVRRSGQRGRPARIYVSLAIALLVAWQYLSRDALHKY